MNNIDICSQILYKKYSDKVNWLTYNDLNRIIKKFCNDKKLIPVLLSK